MCCWFFIDFLLIFFDDFCCFFFFIYIFFIFFLFFFFFFWFVFVFFWFLLFVYLFFVYVLLMFCCFLLISVDSSLMFAGFHWFPKASIHNLFLCFNKLHEPWEAFPGFGTIKISFTLKKYAFSQLLSFWNLIFGQKQQFERHSRHWQKKETRSLYTSQTRLFADFPW